MTCLTEEEQEAGDVESHGDSETSSSDYSVEAPEIEVLTIHLVNIYFANYH